MQARRHSLSRYLPPASDPSTHFRISRGRTLHGFADLPCLVARLWADGKFELLNPAWDALGYSSRELMGHPVCDLIALEPQAASAAVRSLLTEGRPLEFALRHKDGHEARYHWNRHFDDFSSSMFVVGDELPLRAPAA
jgi:PAS domain-containing protein